MSGFFAKSVGKNEGVAVSRSGEVFCEDKSRRFSG